METAIAPMRTLLFAAASRTNIQPIGHLSLLVILVLLLILVASSAIFSKLSRRNTTQRRQTAIDDWADSKYLTFHPAADAALISLNLPLLNLPDAAAELLITGSDFSIAQLRSDSTRVPQHFHILLRSIEHSARPCALRPTLAAISIIDHLRDLRPVNIASSSRFTAFSNQNAAAVAFAKSPAAARLPADVGLFVGENVLILDFTSRRFDEIEFNRMIDLSEQIAKRLPVPKKAASKV